MALNLRTSNRQNWRMVDLLPVDGTPPVFPHVCGIIQNITVVQCPVEPKNVYLIAGNHHHNPSWEVWRLDLTAMQWHRTLRHFGVPTPMLAVSCITAAISPSGQLYVLHTVRPISEIAHEARSSLQVNQRIRPLNDLFCAPIRVRHLKDLCLDIAMELMHSVNPDWPRIRTVRNVMAWKNSRASQRQ